MLLGFFCTGLAAGICMGIPSHQAVVAGRLPACPDALTVTRNNQVIAAYVDDTTPDQPAAVQCASRVVANVWTGQFGRDLGVSNGLVEWYPVADHHSGIGPAPPAGQAGYILQSFSWGDNLDDGRNSPWHRCTMADSTSSCAARYQTPSTAQLHTMWCRALAWHPHVILWYYGASLTSTVLRVEHEPC